jgi:hypothetical protein
LPKPSVGQHGTLQALVEKLKEKLSVLANDIVQNGPDPSNLPIRGVEPLRTIAARHQNVYHFGGRFKCACCTRAHSGGESNSLPAAFGRYP